MTRANSEETRPLAYRDGRFVESRRCVPEETAIAFSVNGTTHAVMMATPDHVHELATGLALNERIVESASQIERIDIAETELGLDCRLWLVPAVAANYVARRRQMTGPVGCGLCGVESLELASRDLPVVVGGNILAAPAIISAMDAMSRQQALSHQTRAVHAAAFHAGEGTHVVTREDVGRHNALDKVAGHLAQAGVDPAEGFLTITSRVSVELVQKAAVMGVGVLAAVSAPTALAIRAADGAGITLLAVVRGAEFELFTHPRRIEGATRALAVAD